jgi:hypothetical protein
MSDPPPLSFSSRAADLGYPDSRGVRTFPDVVKTHCAYCEILKASHARDCEKDTLGEDKITHRRKFLFAFPAEMMRLGGYL